MKRYLIMGIGAVLASVILTGCIPKNDHVGKPEAHYYKDSYYNGYYNGGYYYR